MATMGHICVVLNLSTKEAVSLSFHELEANKVRQEKQMVVYQL